MRRRVSISLATLTRSSAARDAETPSEPAGEVGSEGGSEEAAKEWADSEAEKIGRIWAARYPEGRDW